MNLSLISADQIDENECRKHNNDSQQNVSMDMTYTHIEYIPCAQKANVHLYNKLVQTMQKNICYHLQLQVCYISDILVL